MNLIRYYSSPLDQVLNAFAPVLNGNGTHNTTAELALDVVETPTAFVVKANVPGVAKDQIDVNVEDRDLTITVEFKDDSVAHAKSLWKERSTGKAARHLRLPEAVDTNAAEARHADGVLYLTLPKFAKPSGKITIQ